MTGFCVPLDQRNPGMQIAFPAYATIARKQAVQSPREWEVLFGRSNVSVEPYFQVLRTFPGIGGQDVDGCIGNNRARVPHAWYLCPPEDVRSIFHIP